MRGLSSLIRLNRWRLDEKRRELAALEQLAADLRAQMTQLEVDVKTEQEAAKTTESGAFAYAGYAQGVIDRRARLGASLVEVEGRIKIQDDSVKETFRELKRYEITLAERKKRQRLELDRRDQAAQDETSMKAHVRKSG
jgi:flagellar protein FliJ